MTVHTPLRIRVPPRHSDSVEGILHGLTNLKLDAVARPLIGDTNVKRSIGRASVDKQPTKIKQPSSRATTTEATSSLTDDSAPRRLTKSKASLLVDLSRRALQATDNATLAACVKEYIKALQMNSSRTLTKEAFQFLEVLHKQLANPSVFIQPKG